MGAVSVAEEAAAIQRNRRASVSTLCPRQPHQLPLWSANDENESEQGRQRSWPYLSDGVNEGAVAYHHSEAYCCGPFYSSLFVKAAFKESLTLEWTVKRSHLPSQLWWPAFWHLIMSSNKVPFPR